jgi:hypothetical protein
VTYVLKKILVLIAAFLTMMLTLSIIPHAIAVPMIIYGDTSDGWVTDTGGINTGFIGLRIGDNYDPTSGDNYPHHGLFKFALAGVSGDISSARLCLYLFSSTHNGGSDNTDPLTNPGLGDCYIRHIADYGTIDGTDFDSPSIGNDPGVFIPGTGGGSTPNIGYICIDVTAAMQDDLDNGRSFSTFLIKLSVDTDNDDLVDEWNFYSADRSGTEYDPYIEYELEGLTVGGIVSPVNRLLVLGPYLTLAVLIVAISTVFIIKKHKI